METRDHLFFDCSFTQRCGRRSLEAAALIEEFRTGIMSWLWLLKCWQEEAFRKFWGNLFRGKQFITSVLKGMQVHGGFVHAEEQIL